VILPRIFEKMINSCCSQSWQSQKLNLPPIKSRW